MGDSQSKTNVTSISDRLQRATNELYELEQLVKSGDLDTRVLRDFRSAIDAMRGTAWAVQQWLGLQAKSEDPYSLLPILSEERVRRTTQLAQELSLDLQSAEVGIETEGLKTLSTAIDDLQTRLNLLFKGGKD